MPKHATNTEANTANTCAGLLISSVLSNSVLLKSSIKKNKNAIIKVSNKLHGIGVKESDKNAANTIKTIKDATDKIKNALHDVSEEFAQSLRTKLASYGLIEGDNHG